MQNNLYNELNNFNIQNQQGFGNTLNNLQGMIQEFNKFKDSFQGDPQQIIQQLLQSGKMSQAQYNQLSQMALQFKNLIQNN